ncbi:hypothetical protein LO762_15110 [Actinocorallia sp. API 0066]|uniref:hypothetical protein n=1 Tax=Actinocorallia sp. API 0066 TaxID=2896846 RepID=UPI001E30A18A|nr:hypothetical protein [Actinocorallia sp. API 0066]MCD0450508.1 hypothetical protein [Actinocorallia sp. API 0066]
MTLDVLEPEDAVALLGEVVGVARVVAELEQERHRLDSLASSEDELSDVRAAFSWSYHALSPEPRTAFRLLGPHAGREIGVDAAAALFGAPDARFARRLLDALCSAHLLREVSRGRYHLHDLLRAYAVERLAEETSPKERTRTVRRVLSWYLLTADAGRAAILPFSHEVPLVPSDGLVIPAFTDAEQAMRWFAVERLNLLAALDQADGEGEPGWRLTGPLAVGRYGRDS